MSNFVVKTFDEAKAESTCQKRITIVEIYDIYGNLLARESNRCNPDGECKRLGVVNNKENYPTEGCNWTHAEINAIAAIPKGTRPYRSVLYGHDFYCDACEAALSKIGVHSRQINNQKLK